MSADPFNNAFWFTHEYMKEDGVWGFVMSVLPVQDTFDFTQRPWLRQIHST
ncbi:MAG: hypothetical protein R2788_03790 [Saprospiraceae bacterium]